MSNYRFFTAKHSKKVNEIIWNNDTWNVQRCFYNKIFHYYYLFDEYYRIQILLQHDIEAVQLLISCVYNTM